MATSEIVCSMKPAAQALRDSRHAHGTNGMNHEARRSVVPARELGITCGATTEPWHSSSSSGPAAR